MSAQLPPKGPPGLDPAQGIAAAPSEIVALQLHAEAVTVSKRVRRTLVRAVTETSSREAVVEAELEQVHVIVDRVSVGRIVDAVPPVRVEGDVTIMPVVEEELVLVRRLVLKEEVHVRTVRTVSQHRETVTLRDQAFSVTRTPLDD